MIPITLIIFSILTLIDYALTTYVITTHKARELNPLMRMLYKHGIIPPLLYKICTIALVWLADYLIGVPLASTGMSIVYSYVVGHNIAELKKILKESNK